MSYPIESCIVVPPKWIVGHNSHSISWICVCLKQCNAPHYDAQNPIIPSFPVINMSHWNISRLWDLREPGLRRIIDTRMYKHLCMCVRFSSPKFDHVHTFTFRNDNAHINTCRAHRDAMRLWGWCESTYRKDPKAYQPIVNYHNWP